MGWGYETLRSFFKSCECWGHGKLPMEDLRRICADCGFENDTTYIASGNIALSHVLDPKAIAHKLSAALATPFAKVAGKVYRCFC